MAEQKARETIEFAGESYMLGRTVVSLALMGQGKYQDALNESRSEPAEALRLANQTIAYFKLGQQEQADNDNELNSGSSLLHASNKLF